MSLGIDDVTDAVEIGRGAFGIVYRGHQKSFDRTVAIKVLANVDVDDASLARFAREVRAVGRLSGHPNIVAVYAHGTIDSGAPYMLMEYCEAGSYGDALRARRRLSWQEATEVAIQIAGALESSHRAGILHRDVKPDNILIDGYGVPKLADFGIARQSSQRSMTATGVLTGSPAHVAPEIVAGLEPTAATDVYSLASSVHALITGEPAFVRNTDSSILPLLQRIATASPPNLRQYGVPAPVADVIFDTMAKDPAARPSSALAFAEALQAARLMSGAPPVAYRVMSDPTKAPADADATVLPPSGWQASVPPGSTAGAPMPPGPASGSSGTPASPPVEWPAAGASRSGPAPDGDATIAGASGFAPPPSPPAGQSPAGRSRSKAKIIAWVAVAVGVVLVGGTAIAVGVAATSLTAVSPTASASPQSSREPSAEASTVPLITDAEAAAAMTLTAAQIADITFTDWEESTGGSVNANAGFCGIQLTRGPREFVQNSFYLALDGPGTLPQVASGGAVFDTADDAADYMRARAESAACGSWVQDGVPIDVFEPPIAPTLVGCECQNVAVHEVVGPAADGTLISQFAILSQEDRYVSAVFYAIPSDFAGTSDTADLVGALIDQSVIQVSSVAEAAGVSG